MIYLFFSAMLYLCSHIFNVCAFACGLFWLIFLYFEYLLKGLSFKQGFCWGIFVYSVHFSWILKVVMYHQMSFLNYLLWLFIVFWFALSAGIWFFCMRFSWIISTVCFFMFLTKFSLVFCGPLEGYCLLNPLLCFVQVPSCLWIIKFFGDYAGFLLLTVFVHSFVSIKNQSFLYPLIISLLCGIYLLIGLLFFQEKEPAINGIYSLKPWWYGCKSAMFAGYRMADSLSLITNFVEEKKIHTVVLPESTFCFDIDEYTDFFPIWSEGLDNVSILFGTHRKLYNYYQNCVLILKNKKIEYIYDKQHLMPFIEKPLFSSFGLISDTFKKDTIKLTDVTYQLFLCSELFFEIKPVTEKKVLFLWNDSWLSFDWTKLLAEKFIQYFTIKYQVAVFHVSTQGKTNISMIGN